MRSAMKMKMEKNYYAVQTCHVSKSAWVKLLIQIKADARRNANRINVNAEMEVIGKLKHFVRLNLVNVFIEIVSHWPTFLSRYRS